jgi:hypothetical protein
MAAVTPTESAAEENTEFVEGFFRGGKETALRYSALSSAVMTVLLPPQPIRTLTSTNKAAFLTTLVLIANLFIKVWSIINFVRKE